MTEKESFREGHGEDAAGKPTKPEDLGRPAEADAEQNRAAADTEEKQRAREEFNLHEADLGRNPQG
jgi:hypothetical protein